MNTAAVSPLIVPIKLINDQRVKTFSFFLTPYLKPSLHLPVVGNKDNGIQPLMQQPVPFLCIDLQKRMGKQQTKSNYLAEIVNSKENK